LNLQLRTKDETQYLKVREEQFTNEDEKQFKQTPDAGEVKIASSRFKESAHHEQEE
jgi:hypothetical protein